MKNDLFNYQTINMIHICWQHFNLVGEWKLQGWLCDGAYLWISVTEKILSRLNFYFNVSTGNVCLAKPSPGVKGFSGRGCWEEFQDCCDRRRRCGQDCPLWSLCQGKIPWRIFSNGLWQLPQRDQEWRPGLAPAKVDLCKQRVSEMYCAFSVYNISL